MIHIWLSFRYLIVEDLLDNVLGTTRLIWVLDLVHLRAGRSLGEGSAVMISMLT